MDGNPVATDTSLSRTGSDSILREAIRANLDGHGTSKLPVGPIDFIQNLAIQNQVLACLRWLSDIQVLPFIPLHGSVSIEEIADLVGVTASQLCRVVRMTATVGFLREDPSGYIAHTDLSAPFVTNLAFLDAATFLVETATPAALHMATAMSQHDRQSAYSIAFPTAEPFALACAKETRLQRQWLAYRRCIGEHDDSVKVLISQLKWGDVGNACIVDVLADSTELVCSLATMYPSLRCIAQLADSAQEPTGDVVGSFDGRVTVRRKVPGSPQDIRGASVYILRPARPFTSMPSVIVAELNAHSNVLCANPAAMLVLVMPCLPEAGAVNTEVEAKMRLRDLCHMQLTDQPDMTLTEIQNMISAVGNSSGRLVASSRVFAPDNGTVALQVKYRASTSRA